jgi:hypothetical protein
MCCLSLTAYLSKSKLARQENTIHAGRCDGDRVGYISAQGAHPVLSLLVLAFCITILWAVITAAKTLQRIATAIELLVRQKEERGAR